MAFLAAWLFLPHSPGPIAMDVYFGGAKVGECRFASQDDGDFRSATRFSIAGQVVDSTLQGKRQDGLIVRYGVDVSKGQSKTSFHYSGERLTARNGKRIDEYDYRLSPSTAASLHPQLTAGLLAGLKGEGPWRVQAFVLDEGVEQAVEVATLPGAVVRGEPMRRLGVRIGDAEYEYDLDAEGKVVAMEEASENLRFVVRGWEALFEGGAAISPELSQPTYRTERVRNLRMRTRDGVLLVADAIRPRERGRYPTILQRTPFGREKALDEGEFWAQRGYVYIAQDCRGRGDSDGEFEPFATEGRDSADAISWIARQSWSDGKVGMMGSGYSGSIQYEAGVGSPTALKCIAPVDPWADPMHGMPYDHGTFAFAESLRWSHAFDTPRGQGELSPPLSGLDRLPLTAVGRASPTFREWLRRTKASDWNGDDFPSTPSEAGVPTLATASYDETDFAEKRPLAKDQWLVYRPSSSLLQSAERFDLEGLTLRFFDTFLKVKSVGMQEVSKVQAFVTGANRWVSLDGWPASTSSFETLYLSPTRLQESPGGSAASVYVYNPAKDRGRSSDDGRVALPPKGSYALFVDPPLAKNEAIAGPFEFRLFFKSSARDTDFFATLLDVAPSGEMQAIGRSGKLRASYRANLEAPSILVPGRIYSALVHPGDAAHEIRAGHRLGLLVTSSEFPRYARNLGTGEPLATGKRSVPQRNVILTGTVTPSRITFRKLW